MFIFNDDGNYYPLFTFDEFWLLRDKLVPLNETVEEVKLHLSVKPQNFWWLQLQQQVCVMCARTPDVLMALCTYQESAMQPGLSRDFFVRQQSGSGWHFWFSQKN